MWPYVQSKTQVMQNQQTYVHRCRLLWYRRNYRFLGTPKEIVVGSSTTTSMFALLSASELVEHLVQTRHKMYTDQPQKQGKSLKFNAMSLHYTK
jgi:hypothetical protein